MGSLIQKIVEKRTVSVLNDVRCERCGEAYAYEVIRTGRGSADSVLGLDNAGARARAAAQAEADAYRTAALARDPVPCPHCGHVQRAAVRDSDERRVGRATSAILKAGGFIAAVTLGVLAGHWRKHTGPAEQFLLPAACIFGGELMLFCIALVLVPRRFAVDPQTFDVLPADHWLKWAQPALTERHDARGPYFAPARRVELIRHGDAVVVQPFRIDMPPNCALCCAPAPQAYVPPVGLSKTTRTYPCCAPCQRVAGRRWWRLALATAAACLFLLFTLADPTVGLLLPRSAPGWVRPALVHGLGGLVTAILALLIPNVVGQPLTRRTLDRDRGWVRVWARNPAYRQLIEARYTDPFVYTLRPKAPQAAPAQQPTA